MDRRDRVGKLRHFKYTNEHYALQTDPIFWKQKAEELRRAALVLAHQHNQDMDLVSHDYRELEAGRSTKLPDLPMPVWKQFVLLASFALENLFKGLIIYREPSLVKDGKITGILGSHDLLMLAARADFALEAEEKRFCMLGSSAAVNWGRYPVSKKVENGVQMYAVGDQALETFDALFHRVVAIYLERFHSRPGKPPSDG